MIHASAVVVVLNTYGIDFFIIFSSVIIVQLIRIS